MYNLKYENDLSVQAYKTRQEVYNTLALPVYRWAQTTLINTIPLNTGMHMIQ